MVGEVTIKVDNTRALAKFRRLPVQVRDNLRRALPPLINQLAASVESKLGSDLKSRKTLTVTRELHDTTANKIYGVVGLESPSAGGLLPTYLEKGTVAHLIKGNPVLAFYWDKIGRQAYFRSVQHPGTKPYEFMSRAFAEMREEIVAQIKEAAKTRLG
jgi:hypothetical protein